MSESGDRPTGPGHGDPTRNPWARPPDAVDAEETVKLTKDQPAEGQPAQPLPPVYQPPTYEPPTYDPPGAEPPTYIPPNYAPPSYEQPSYAPPPYSDPGPAAGYGQPYPQPGYPPADPYQQYGAPAYGQQPAVQPYGYGSPPGYPGGGYGYGAATAGKATAVMILGIASLVTVWCYGIGVIPAIVGLVMSGSAKREIESSGGRLTGLGLVTAGRVMGWITVGLTVIFAGLLALGVILAAVNDPTYTGN